MEYHGAELRWFLRHHLSFEIVRRHLSYFTVVVMLANIPLSRKVLSL